MKALWTPNYTHVEQCLNTSHCAQWPTYSKWKVPGEWQLIPNFKPTYNVSRTEFDGQFESSRSFVKRLLNVEKWRWTSSHALYDPGTDEYISNCSRQLLQLRDRRFLFLGDSTTERTVRALAHMYEEVHGSDPMDWRIEHTVPVSNETYFEYLYPRLNATVFFFPANFITHTTQDSFKRAAKLWATRLPSKGPPSENNLYEGAFKFDTVYTGTAMECTVCQVLLNVLQTKAVDVAIVNGGAWFNAKKVRRLHALTAFEIAMRAFWQWARNTNWPGIWYFRTTNTGHFFQGKCLQKEPTAHPAIDKSLKELNKGLNRLAVQELQAHVDHMHLRLLDSGNVMYHRSDAHCAYRRSRIKVNYYDCLHYCWPGPWRWIIYIFLKSLTCDSTCDFCSSS